MSSPTQPTEAHRVEIRFDDGIYAKLIHPEGGCKEATQCINCDADLTLPADAEHERCHDCEGINPGECWLEGWFDNLTPEELFHGQITVPVNAEWGEHDAPVFTLIDPAPALRQQGAEEAEKRLTKRLEEKKRECEDARDRYGAAGNVDSEAYWQGKGHGFASALAVVTNGGVSDA